MGKSLYRTNRHFSRLACKNIVQTDSLYKKAELMYSRLNERHSSHFKNIIDVFKKEDCREEVFKSDAIHYSKTGSKVIARNIIEDLINKKILTIDNRKDELLSTNTISKDLIEFQDTEVLQTKKEYNWFMQ